MLIRHERKYLIRLPYDLVIRNRSDIRHETVIHIEKRDTDDTCRLCFIEFDEGYERYEKYEADRVITLGSSIDDDLYVQSSFLEENALSIDIHGRRIYRKQKDLCFALNHAVIHAPSISFRTCDILECFNVRIIFHDAFIMVNRCANIYPTLQKAKSMHAQPVPLQTVRHEPSWHVFVFRDPVIRMKLQEPESMPVPQEYSVLISAAPAVLMSAASFMSGLIHAYSGWMNGRSWMEILPLLLMPAMMIMSSLLLMPYARYLQKRSVLKRIAERDSRYEAYLRDVKQDIISQIELLKKSYAEAFFTPERTDPFSAHPLHRFTVQKALFCAGSTEDLLRIEAEVPVINTPGRLKEIIDSFREFCMMKYEIPFIADLDKEKDISVLCSFEQALWIISQLAVYCDPGTTAMVLLIKKEDLMKHYYLLSMPHLMHDIRYAAVSHAQLETIRRSLRTENRKVIVLHLWNDLQLEDESYLHLRFFERDMRAGLLIDMNDASVQNTQGAERIRLKVPACRINYEKLFSAMPASCRKPSFKGSTFFDMEGIQNENELRIRERWEKNRCAKGIRAYIGFDENGDPVIIDLSQKGCGPHGLIAGTTGSGKSELIISLLLSLAVNYSPKELQIVLIDFKGGGVAQAFNAEHPLPHLAGVLTDLDIDEMKRALVSFRNECRRREDLFRKVHDITSLPVMDINDFRRILPDDCGLECPAELLIIVDEFAELKKQRPEFMQELISCARIGRSLGIHLILSTQKIGSVVNEEILSNSRFRICLKVSQKQDSAEIIGTAEAMYLKEAGEFIFCCEDHMTRGRAAYANARRAPDPCNVMTVDETCSVILDHSETMPAGIPQISRILSLLAKEAEGIYVRKLWCDPLRHADKDLKSESQRFCIGMADDLVHTEQYPCCLDDCRTNLILSSSLPEKKRFIHALLYAFMEECREGEEVFLIDDLYAAERKIAETGWRITDMTDSADPEKTNNLIRYIRNDRHCEKHLLITDAARFLEADDGNREILHELIANAEGFGLYLYLIISSTGAISFRDQTLLSSRIALYHHSSQEIQILLGCSSSFRIKEGFGAFLKEGPVLFRMKDISESELLRKAAEDRQKHPQKKYQIPCMPAHIYADECEDDLFGIAVSDYRRIIRRKGEKFIITAVYEDELEEFAGMYENACIAKSEEEIRAFLEKEEGILAASFRMIEHSPSLYIIRENPILFAGSGYFEQYLFTSKIRHLQENEGVLIFRSKSEVIRLAEKS